MPSLECSANTVPKLTNMKRHHIKWAVLAAGTVAATTCTTNVQGQAVDSLLDKLVDKGILTEIGRAHV